MSVGLTLFAFIVVLGPLILIHELGHFLLAKRAGVRVEEFGFGFPPRLMTLFRRGETEYTLNLLPFGAFVRMTGEEDPSDPRSLAAQPKRWRLAVLGAGPVANILAASLLFIVSFMAGYPAGDGVRIMAIAPNTPAEAAGLQVGDIVRAMDGRPVRDSLEMVTYTHQHLGEEIRLTVERAGETLTLSVVPRLEWPQGQGPMGVEIRTVTVPRYASPPEAVGMGLRQTAQTAFFIVSAPVHLLQGRLSPEEARPVGPVGISQMAGQAVRDSARTGNLFSVLNFAGLISMALGLTNLLPLPALDGGRMLFVFIEAVRGKRVDPQKEGIIHFIGMAVLIFLMLLITMQDIANPIRLEGLR